MGTLKRKVRAIRENLLKARKVRKLQENLENVSNIRKNMNRIKLTAASSMILLQRKHPSHHRGLSSVLG